jgi:hypothetical protein
MRDGVKAAILIVCFVAAFLCVAHLDADTSRRCRIDGTLTLICTGETNDPRDSIQAGDAGTGCHP